MKALPSLLLIAWLFLLPASALAQNGKGEAYYEAYRKEAAERTLQIFPGVNPQFRKHVLALIAMHAGKQGLLPLQENGLRLVTQPMGIVGEFYDVNLESGEVTVIPGTHHSWRRWQFTLSAEKLAKLKAVFDSLAFQQLPQENRLVGADGTSLFVELKWKGEHRWIIHWGELEEVLQEPFKLVRPNT